MIKTLFASLCVVACCMGNDYPAKASTCSYNNLGTQTYQDCFSRQLDVENETRRQLEEQRRDIDDQIRFGTYSSY